MTMIARAAARLRSLFARPNREFDATLRVRSATIEATITRADGTVEHLGTIATMGDPA